MDKIESKIRAGLCRNICPNCNNELSVIFNGLFGKTYERVKNSGIKYISGCCFDKEYYYCDKCHEYFDENIKVCIKKGER